MDIGTLMVLLKATDQMSPVMRQAAQSVDQLAPSVQAASRSSTQAFNTVGISAKQASTNVTSASKGMQTAMGGLTDSLSPVPLGMAGVGIAAGLMAKQSIQAASDLAESQNKVDVVFGKSAASIRQFADDAATSLGMSEAAALQATGTIGNMLVAMEMSRPAAAEMSRGIVQLSADLGSFNNIPTAEALEKIRAGLVGETEPLRSLGVNLSAATIQAKALSMGLAETTAALTPAMKAQAAYALILEQTETAQGDFARTADGAANSMKSAQASFQDFQATIGTLVLPAVAALAQEMTTTIETATELVNVLGQLSLLDFANVQLDGALFGDQSALESFLTFAIKAEPMGHALGNAAKAAGDGFSWMKDQVGLAEDEGSELVPVIRAIADELTDATEKSTIFEQVVAAMREEFNRTRTDGQELIDLLARMTNEAETGGESLGKSGRSIAEISHQARIGKGELTEFANSSEMVSDSVARANQNLAYMGEASRLALQGQENLNTAWGQANETVGFWESNLSNAEQALAILDGEMEENGKLTAEQQRQYDTLTWAVDRYKGGVEDTEGAVVTAAEAQANYTKALDDLNREFDGGKENPAEYARRMAQLVAETDPATASSYNMAAAQSELATVIQGTVNKIGNLLIDLGLLPESKRTEFSTPGMPEAQQGVDTLNQKIDGVPDSMTVTAHVDITQAVIALDTLRGMTFTESPPKEGPMAFQPDFSYIFESLVPAAELFGKLSTDRVASYLPMGSPTIGALTRPIDWAFLFAGMDTEAEDFAKKSAEKIADFIMGFDTEKLASGDLLQQASEQLAQLFDAKAIAEQMGLGEEIIASIQAAIDAQQAELEAIGQAMTTPIVEAAADQLAAVAAMEEAAKIAEEAWDAWTESVEKAAEAAALLAEKQAELISVTQDAIKGISGDDPSNFLSGLVDAFDEAKAAVDFGQLLGFPPEVMEQLYKDLSEAEGALNEGTRMLKMALLKGLIDEDTLKQLAETGGEWFETLYDQLFGPGALDAIQAGWNDIDQITIERLAQLAGLMEDGGAEVIGPLIDAIAAGAISYEDALGMLSEATGEQVNIMIDELERLQAALIVQLAEAFLAGTDPTGIEANLAIIEQLLASLADRAVETANVVIQAGKSMAMGYKAAADEMAAANASTAAVATSTSAGGPLGYNNNPGLNSMDRNGDGIVDGSRRGYSSRTDPNRPGAPRTAGSGGRDYYEGSRLSQEELRGIRDAVREGAAAGTSSGFSGWQPPLGGR